MTGKFLERDGRRVRLSTLTLPAPARFPYVEHRCMDAVMADEQSTVLAVHSFVADATFADDSATEMAGRESALTLDPGPDQTACKEATGYAA